MTEWMRDAARTQAIVALVTLGSLLLVLAGCSFSAQADQRVTVEIVQRTRFNPGNVTIQQGMSVVWHNRSDRGHWISSDPVDFEDGAPVLTPDGGDPVVSERFYPGELFTHQFNQPGTWVVGSLDHWDTGMLMIVEVE